MEVWDLYDKNKVKLGATIVRGEDLPEGAYHLVVHIWIQNGEGKYLISQRAASRPTFPLMWECQGGSVLAGEDGLQGALRETKEEVGVDLDPKCGKLLFTKVRDAENGKKFKDILEAWNFRYDGEVDLSRATTDEVAQVKWLTKDDIRALISKGAFVPTLTYILDI